MLDPANYITLPGAAWDAMLSMTNIKLELISDEKVLDIIEFNCKYSCLTVNKKLC